MYHPDAGVILGFFKISTFQLFFRTMLPFSGVLWVPWCVLRRLKRFRIKWPQVLIYVTSSLFQVVPAKSRVIELLSRQCNDPSLLASAQRGPQVSGKKSLKMSPLRARGGVGSATLPRWSQRLVRGLPAASRVQTGGKRSTDMEPRFSLPAHAQWRGNSEPGQLLS